MNRFLAEIVAAAAHIAGSSKPDWGARRYLTGPDGERREIGPARRN